MKFIIFNKDLSTKNKVLRIFKYKYYLNRSLDIIFTILVTDSLIKFFANKNLLLPLRKLSFLL